MDGDRGGGRVVGGRVGIGGGVGIGLDEVDG